MNHKYAQSFAVRLSICLLLLFVPRPMPVGAGSVGAGLRPAPKKHAQPAAVDALNFTAVSAGDDYTCAIVSGGGVKCWGGASHTPVDVTGLEAGVTAIAAGKDHTCAIGSGGGVMCWGNNEYGELGDGTNNNSSIPVDVVGLDQGVTAIAAGQDVTCALLSGGGVKCWGWNKYGRLGDGTYDDHNTPVDVIGLDQGVTAIAAGGLNTCALKSSGGVVCWGVTGFFPDEFGGYYITRNTPGDIAGLENGVTDIAVGGYHACALLSGGGVKCWGGNGSGQLGHDTGDDVGYVSTPVDVSGLEQELSAITTHNNHTCVMIPGDDIQCWGENWQGQLGDGTITNRIIPVNVTGLPVGVSAISAGKQHTCALAPYSRIMCWGSDIVGQLGDNPMEQRSIPVEVAGQDSQVSTITAGYYHTCMLGSGGGVKCWGMNLLGQMGNGKNEESITPVDVIGLGEGVTSIAAGMNHTCAIVSGGGVKCWGYNANGELGDGTTENRNTPVDVVGLASGVTAIAGGGYYTCAIVSGGGVKCWGGASHTPVDVTGLEAGVTAIAAGWNHTCVIVAGGGAKCWGQNWAGQLGDGTTEDRDAPVDVVGLTSGVTAITAGNTHTCAIISGGAKCWGYNEDGQLGDGTSAQRNTPVDVAGLTSGVTAINTEDAHTCALTSGGKAWCWGRNEYGQLGDCTTVGSSLPVEVSGLEWNATAIAPSSWHTCALAGAGRPKCWGAASNGQLGNGDGTRKLTPVYVIESIPLSINYAAGLPGSFFTVTGWNFPPSAQATLSINGQGFTTTLTVNPTGSFIFFLDTTGAEEGYYLVMANVIPGSPSLGASRTAAATPSAGTSARFYLAGDSSLRPQEGGGETYTIPGGFALHNVIHLPVVFQR